MFELLKDPILFGKNLKFNVPILKGNINDDVNLYLSYVSQK